MSFSIIEAVLGQITPSSVDKIALATGETPVKSRSAMTAGAFAVVAGLVRRGATRAGAASMLTTLQSPPGLGAPGVDLAPSLLGGQADRVTDDIARASGSSRSGASTIMSWVLPLAGAVLGREVMSRRLDADGLSNLLRVQKQSLLSHPSLPSGMGSLFTGPELEGLSERPVVTERAERVGIYDERREERRPIVGAAPQRTLVPVVGALVLGLLLLGALLLLVGRRPMTPRVSFPQRPTVEAPVANAPNAPAPEEGKAPGVAPVEEEKTGQTTITGAEVGKPATDELDSEFGGKGALPSRMPLSVHFKFASTELTDGDPSLDHLAALMKQHPHSRVRLEGHTDSAGNADVNTPLSYQRAMTVRQKLIERGVDGARIEAIGKRDKEPVASNATQEGRAENRRIDLVILSR